MNPRSNIHPNTDADDLRILDNGIVFDAGREHLDYMWFHVLEREAGRAYDLHRVVRLGMLRYLPQEARHDAGLLDTMRTALTGLYNQRRADYDPCMIVAGIFDPPLGVVQCYGAVGIAEEKEAALRHANLGLDAVTGVMANFPQSRLVPLDVVKAEWLRDALITMPHALVLIGQPDPRLSARGMGREGPGEQAAAMAGETAYPLQQNEMLFRALAQAQEEFLFVVLASRVAQHDLATMLEGIAAEASVPASRQTGGKSISFGISLPLIASGSLGKSAGTQYGQSEAASVSDGISESDAVSHTQGEATTVGHAVTEGHSHTEGRASTSGGSVSHTVSVVEGASHVESRSQGTADTVGEAHTQGHARSHGGSSSVSVSETHVPAVTSVGVGQSQGMNASVTAGHTESESVGSSATVGSSSGSADAHGASHSQGYDAGARVLGVGGGVQEGVNESFAHTEREGNHSSMSASHGHTTSESGSATVGASQRASRSVTHTPAHTVRSSSRSSSSFASTTHSEAHTTSRAHTESESRGQADGVNRSVARTTSRSRFNSTTHSSSDTVSHAETRSWSKSKSRSEGRSHAVSRSHATGRTSATNVGRALSVARSAGLSAGIAPSISASKSYQWYDDQAIQLTAILRAQEELLRQATLEGAYLTDAYVLCGTHRGAVILETAVRQAFHGSALPVVTPVQTRRLTEGEQAYVCQHAGAFTPSTREETIAGALEAYRDTTLLLPLQLAAYTAPGLFEEGAAVTTQERTPAFAFVPDMPGDVVLGHLISTETGRLTSAPLRLSEDRMFHTAFAADTGYGKTVAAERLATETAQKWGYRTVVLDFGAGWRRLLNTPLGRAGRVEVRQVFPGATVPFRWNPLQIGRHVNPERQMLATCELIRNAGQMGPRQLGFMRRALKALYVKHGILTSYKDVLADERWNHVRDDEWDVLNAARVGWGMKKREVQQHLPLSDLEPFERQALAVHRSRHVDLAMWHAELARIFARLKPQQVSDKRALQGILLRVEPLVEGEMGRMYGRSLDVRSPGGIESLGLLGPDDAWGISILEGGAEMDEFAKAVVFSLVAWHLYSDAVVRRRLSIGRGGQQRLQIFFEEANKVLTGVAGTDSQEYGGNQDTSSLWLQMWRDGRKYGIWLHVIAQTVSELPPGILSSCNNGFFSQTKQPADRDLMMAHLAFSEKGFTDEDYKRFISRMPVAQAICKLGYSQDVAHTTPFLCRPVMLKAPEPPEEALWARDYKGQKGETTDA